MREEHISANLASWLDVEAFVERMGDDQLWSPWKALAHRFLAECVKFGLNRYFRAGQSMHHLVFSTLDHHGLRNEPRVTVELHPENDLRIAYPTGNLYFSAPELEYTLPFDQAFPTFVRFLNQLWSATMPESIPDAVRAPLKLLKAPVFT